MKLWQWQDGRQMGTRYKKFPLWYFRIWKWGFDAYILKYEADTVLHPHRDPVAGRHYRVNIGWGNANFYCEKMILAEKLGRLSVYLFRPDLYVHSLFVHDKTTKLSFGFVKFD